MIEEIWTARNMQRSLYPIAWSATNFVLHTLSADSAIPGFADSFFRASEEFSIPAGAIPVSPLFVGAISCDIRVIGNMTNGFLVRSTAITERDGARHEMTVSGLLSPVPPDGWTIEWR